VSKLRNSDKCARAITLKEMSEDIKDTIELNFKYRDYKTAFELIDQPYYQHLQPWVFEHWVKTLLQESTADDKVINERIRMNFIKMK